MSSTCTKLDCIYRRIFINLVGTQNLNHFTQIIWNNGSNWPVREGCKRKILQHVITHLTNHGIMTNIYSCTNKGKLVNSIYRPDLDPVEIRKSVIITVTLLRISGIMCCVFINWISSAIHKYRSITNKSYAYFTKGWCVYSKVIKMIKSFVKCEWHQTHDILQATTSTIQLNPRSIPLLYHGRKHEVKSL